MVVTVSAQLKRQMGWDIGVVTLIDDFTRAHPLRDAGVPILSLSLGSVWNWPLGTVRLARIVAQWQPDIVHAHLFQASVVVALSQLLGSPHGKPVLLVSEHSTTNRRRGLPGGRVFDEYLYGKYKAVICVSKAVESSLLQWLPSLRGRTRVIYNPVHIPPFTWDPRGPKDWDVLYVGRLVEQKGVDVLLHAVHAAATRMGPLRVAIAGDGPLRLRLEKAAEALGISGMIDFMGWQKDPTSLMLRTKVIVIPSRCEGLGNVVLEAMSVGVPIVASRVGGITELLEDGVSGRLVPGGNAETLGEALAEVLAGGDRGAAERWGANARARAQAYFRMDIHVATIAQLYESVTGRLHG
ncbi:MAG: glycosyltransferase [Limnochordaceae bacterium]|nr:glycosyltransferase [Limnochordaceae bacterium]